MGNLRRLGLVEMDEHGLLTLTPNGLREAEQVLERHLLITGWLVGLGVREETAAEDACRIEHVISQESFDCIRRHVEKRTLRRRELRVSFSPSACFCVLFLSKEAKVFILWRQWCSSPDSSRQTLNSQSVKNASQLPAAGVVQSA